MAYKYPINDPDLDTVRRVQAIVEEAEPPRYEDQGGQRRKKNKRAKDDDEDENVAENPDEVLESMEKMCLREAQHEVKMQAGFLVS